MSSIAELGKSPRVIVILGQTASGKSSLAVGIAKALGSMIISADAFQVYRGFGVASDKISQTEMQGIPHYGIDIVEPTDLFTVKQFMDYSIPLIEEELVAGRSPIIVGGTHMYIEKLLFTSRLDEIETSIDAIDNIGSETKSITSYSHADLVALDPAMAERIHPNDLRRISRAIEFFHSSGERMSDVLSRQHRQLRWNNLLVLCKTVSPDFPLHERIRERVMHKMVLNNALRSELERIKPLVDSNDLHWNKGLLQAIGYREFESFVTHLHDAKAANQLFDEGVEAVIRNTIKYSKQQKKWITRLNKSINIHFVDDSFDIPAIISIIESSGDSLRSPCGVPQWKRPS